MDIKEKELKLREKAAELLSSGKVKCVIGYERGTDGVNARPFFAYSHEESQQLIFDQTCVHNLAKYLINKKGIPTAIVAKACDERAINLLLKESQIKREEVLILGVVCDGIVQRSWSRASAEPEPRCQACQYKTPLVYDFLVGEAQPLSEASLRQPKELPQPSYPDIEKYEAMSAKEKADFWREQSEKCIRCYGCRQVCPGCYCFECFADILDPLWLGIRIAPPENQMWLTGRAFHLAGRCVDCGECQRVCPVQIPLMLLNHKLLKEVGEKFNFQPGIDAGMPAPFETFNKDESLGFSH